MQRRKGRRAAENLEKETTETPLESTEVEAYCRTVPNFLKLNVGKKGVQGAAY